MVPLLEPTQWHDPTYTVEAAHRKIPSRRPFQSCDRLTELPPSKTSACNASLTLLLDAERLWKMHGLGLRTDRIGSDADGIRADCASRRLDPHPLGWNPNDPRLSAVYGPGTYRSL